jgi:putative ABC transport system ATP-binding protein
MLVTVRDLHKTYRLGETEVHALRGVDLNVETGEFLSLVGKSGSGKSTLLNMVGCIDDPTKGTVQWDGTDVSSLSETQKARLRNKKIGFVFQTFNLIPVLTALENVELPLAIQKDLTDKERRQRAMSALEDVGLHDFMKSFPDRLSGGQRQRVAIARALVVQPMLIIADEPTANLDSQTANMIVDLMIDLNQKRGVTFLFSTHDEKLMKRVSRTVHIMDGKIV